MEKKVLSILIIVFMITVSVPQITQGQDRLDLSISGTVKDNYANLTYSLIVAPEQRDFTIVLPRQEGLFLSNASLSNSNITLWGRVTEAKEAEQIYNETVTAEEVGMLIDPVEDKYLISINNPVKESLEVKLFLEGMLTRDFGRYLLPLLPDTVLSFQLDVDLEITSTVSTVLAIEVKGLEGQSLTRIGNGFKLVVNDALPTSAVSLNYVLSDYDLSASIVSYSDGTNGFFNFFLAPKLELADSPSTRQIIFTIDVSGSMSGTRLDQAKLALTEIIETLGPNDQFNIVPFSDEATTMWAEVRAATEQNKEDAIGFVETLHAQTSTNIYDAVTVSLNQFFESDAEKLMILISDGVPTAGITDPDAIRSHTRESNTLGVGISTIAIGESGVEALLEGIALDNNGTFVLVRNDEEISDAISALFSQLYVPPIDQISFTFTAGVVLESLNINLTSGFLALSNGSEIVVSGKFVEQNVTITANYRIGNETFRVSENALITEGGQPYAEKMWALQRIQYLVGLNTLIGTDEFKQQIVSLGIQYGLLVPDYTAMILSTLIPDQNSHGDSTEIFTGRADQVEILTRLATPDSANSSPIPFYAILIAPLILVWIKRKFKR
ncbi:MAG: VWA domain-containing protein [Methanobacteriota archaeon]|nr:MAG: VWA domain-containing protein [Euryarchaeota archaeon]